MGEFMKIVSKKKIGIFLVLIGFVIFGFFFWQKITKPDLKNANLSAQQIPKWTASTQALVSKNAFKKALSPYFPAVKTMKITDENSPIVPGLLGAWSIDPKTGKAAYATKWTPQGITAISNQYILVTAYDGNHHLDSLVYVVDFKTGKYLKTVILPNQAHVGGITYDEKRQNIWISTDEKKAAELTVLKLSTLKAYDAKKSKKAIRVDETFKLPWLKATSTIAYSELDNAIIVPYFSTETSSLYGLPLNDQGMIDDQTILSTGQKNKVSDLDFQNLLKHVYCAEIPAKVQGFASLGNGYVGTFNASYGNVSSSVRFTAWYLDDQSNTSLKEFKFKNISVSTSKKNQIIKMPPYLEQVAAHDDTSLYYLFESGATKYRLKTPEVIDRIVSVSYDDKGVYEQAKSALKPEKISLPSYDEFHSK